MLKVHNCSTSDGCPIGCRSFVCDASVFYNVVDWKWFDDSLVREILWDVDKVQYVGDGKFQRKDSRMATVQELSIAVRGLILIAKCFTISRVFSITLFGNESVESKCLEWIRKLSFKRDFGIFFAYPVSFEKDKPVMAQRWDIWDWEQCDFHTTTQLNDYIMQNSFDFEQHLKVPVGDLNKVFDYTGDATWGDLLA